MDSAGDSTMDAIGFGSAWYIRLASSVIVVAVAFVAAGCGGTAGSSSSTTTSGATTAPSSTTTGTGGSTTTTLAVSGAVSASRGCGSQASPGTVSLAPKVDGISRVAIVHLPSGYRTTTPVSLVINMHGSMSTARDQEGLTGMDATADADTFIVAYPQGGIPASPGFSWNIPGQPLFGGAAVPGNAPDDVSFIERLVTILEQKYCVDWSRVYATGFSGGARMASQLACDASSVFAAVAPVSGLRFPTPCPSKRPVPVASFHGTADPVDPYLGNGQKYWTYSVPVAAQDWAVHDGCSPNPQSSQPGSGVALTAYGKCSRDSAVELYTIAGEGHEWPGGPQLRKQITAVLGPQTRAISANATMWGFFVAHPLP